MTRLTDEAWAALEQRHSEGLEKIRDHDDLIAECRRAREAEARDFRPDVVFARGFRQGAAEEREACADIADQHNTCEGIAQKIAAAIRARGEKP